MNSRTSRLSFLWLASTLASAACAEASSKTTEPETPPTPTASSASGPVYPSEQQGPVDAFLGAYEEARKLFVADQADGLIDAARRMASAASEGTKAAPAEAQPHLQALVKASSDLEAALGQGIEPGRKAYGEVSRHVVALLVSYPSLAAGRFVFQCPMAPGYRKWVQTDGKLQNPYMGQRMPACGGSTDWKI